MEQSIKTSKVGQENETAEPEATKSMPVVKIELQAQMTSDTILEEKKEEDNELKPEPIEDLRQQHEEEKQQPVESTTQQQPVESTTQKLKVSVKEDSSETDKVERDSVEKVQENVTVEKDENKMGSKSLKRRTRYCLKVVYIFRKSNTRLESGFKCCCWCIPDDNVAW